MDDEEEKIVVAGVVIAIAWYGLVKPLRDDLFGDPEDAKLISDTALLDNSVNPFSPFFSPFLNYWTNSNWNGLGSEAAFFVNEKENPNAASDVVEGLYDSFGLLHSDANKVMSIFTSLQYKADVAYMAGYLLYNYNVDLLNFLKTGQRWVVWLNNGLTDKQVAGIIRHVNTLPDTD